MNKKENNNYIDERYLPLVSTLKHAMGRHYFHMPGNRSGYAFPQELQQLLLHFENTELDVTGDINQPNAAVAKALALTAEVHGAAKSYFVTSGSSCSLMIALASAFKPGERVLLPKANHMSIVNTINLLDLKPSFIRQTKIPRFPDGQPYEEEILHALTISDDIKGLILTSPGYYGQSIPLKRICDLAHKKKIKVIIDAAHGAHFSIDISENKEIERNWPQTALEQGADLVVHSAHKTLPALTPASLLHISHDAIANERISCEKVEKFLPIFQTSSPSFPIAASLDYARYFLQFEAAAKLYKLLALITEFEKSLPKTIKRNYMPGDDPCRLVLDFSETTCERPDVIKILDAHSIDVEMVDARRILCLLPFDTKKRAFSALLAACKDIAHADKKNNSKSKAIDLAQRKAFLSDKNEVKLRKTTLWADSERLSLNEAENRYAAEIVAAYPPGVPLLWPGEKIKESDILLLQSLNKLAYNIRGIKDRQISVLLD